jgi:hypothetical protein
MNKKRDTFNIGNLVLHVQTQLAIFFLRKQISSTYPCLKSKLASVIRCYEQVISANAKE